MDIHQPIDGEDSDALRLRVDNPIQSIVDFLCLAFGKAFIVDGVTMSGDLRHLVIPNRVTYRMTKHPCLNNILQKICSAMHCDVSDIMEDGR